MYISSMELVGNQPSLVDFDVHTLAMLPRDIRYDTNSIHGGYMS